MSYSAITNCRTVARLAQPGGDPNGELPAAYAAVQSNMDLTGYIDYIIGNLYVGNFDWPSNNFRFASHNGYSWFLPWWWQAVGLLDD